ncbi:nitric-oxide reductase, subunit B [gamma proteobacterium HdN1]|nr:nitric-oxide reductase, subunit B [gamma proteobacterium HdN1]
MSTNSLLGGSIRAKKNIALWLVSKKNWILQFLIVAAICTGGLLYLGAQTYISAPPIVNFVNDKGDTVFSEQQIMDGKHVWSIRGLMAYGSFWGDGAERGPDFTADSLHRSVVAMREFYAKEKKAELGVDALPVYETDAIAARVIRELHNNAYDEEAGIVRLNPAQEYAFAEVREHYRKMFNDATYSEAFHPQGLISDPEQITSLTSFFFWGGWASAANRPGETYSYTHNWPHDPGAGNAPTPATWIWSFLSILALFLCIVVVLYVYGQMRELPIDVFGTSTENPFALTTHDLENGYVRPTQKATYKFFALAMILFGVQIFAGIAAAWDFVKPFGISLNDFLPFTASRSFHAIIQIVWFFVCWVGYTIFFLPRLSKLPSSQRTMINSLFAMIVIVGLGTLIGVYLSTMGFLDGWVAYWFGTMGWEFMEMGRFFQLFLLVTFSFWIYIIYRGVKNWLTRKNIWSVPAWLLYGSGIMVLFLFFGVLILEDQNFAIADYWRWMVVHMWVEVTFEVFTTVIVGYLLVQMGLVTRLMAERTIFLAVMLFLITAVIGISHNFYWIAKPTGIIALGSIFSTLQVLPMLLLTLDAWKMRQELGRAHDLRQQGRQVHVMEGVWLFILGVNFWNIVGAGVLGSLINLPIVNYYEHATYLTPNHAHAAMFGVKGNIAIAGMLFCLQHMFHKSAWSETRIKGIFWSLQIGLVLMMVLDMFPVGLYQVWLTLQDGLWHARSSEVILGPVFASFTYLRVIGIAVFVLGGALPLIWFVLSRGRTLQQETEVAEGEWTAYEDDEPWVAVKK